MEKIAVLFFQRVIYSAINHAGKEKYFLNIKNNIAGCLNIHLKRK